MHGLSSGDFIPALEEFFGSGAGLSAKSVQRLSEAWQEERERFMERDLSERDYVYVWVTRPPKTDPVTMRVRMSTKDGRRTLESHGQRVVNNHSKM